MRIPNDFINVYGTLPKQFWTMKKNTMLEMISDELHLDVYHHNEVQNDSIHLNEPTLGMFKRTQFVQRAIELRAWIHLEKKSLRTHKDKNAFRVPEEWRTKEKRIRLV